MGKWRAWQQWELDVLIKLYPTHTASNIALSINRPVKSVSAKAEQLSLKKKKSKIINPKYSQYQDFLDLIDSYRTQRNKRVMTVLSEYQTHLPDYYKRQAVAEILDIKPANLSAYISKSTTLEIHSRYLNKAA